MQAIDNPEISEWGNPSRVYVGILEFEYIELQSYTGGSETSQYPEEKKSMRLRK
jgi:hypothetical protein